MTARGERERERETERLLCERDAQRKAARQFGLLPALRINNERRFNFQQLQLGSSGHKGVGAWLVGNKLTHLTLDFVFKLETLLT